MIRTYNQDCFEFIKTEEFKNLVIGKNLVIITDPPFNIGYHYKNFKDKENDDIYFEKLTKILTYYNSPFVIIHYPESLYKLVLKLNKTPTRVVSWVYNSNTAKQHRDIAFFDIKPDFNKVKQPYKNPTDKRIKECIKNGKVGARLYDWWNINQVKNVSKKISHPCVMPLEVMENIVGILPKDIIVFDPFMGSGTTAIACWKGGVDFIGCEIDKTYYEEAIQRIEGELNALQNSSLC